MCGIFGYVGMRTAEPILIEGLRTLEYRGYDSSGIFIPKFGCIKAEGSIDNLVKKITVPIPGTSGIGHTRWATHGAPSEKNAHPHTDASGNIWLVHNGIIENYRELKEILRVQGYTFQSDTDTEVLAKLIGSFYTNDLFDAVRMALRAVKGTYGIAIMHKKQPDQIIVARMGSPILIGIGVDGNYVASDASAFLSYTKDVVYLNDAEIANVTKDTYAIHTLAGDAKMRKSEKITWDTSSVQKNGYEHFLLKEIMEIPETIDNAMRGRLILGKGRVKLGGFESVLTQLVHIERMLIVGCGSAAYAGQVGKNMLETYAHLLVDVDLGSEFRYRVPLTQKKTAFLAITQSGETADTLASLRKAKEMDMLTLGMVNVVGSSIAREVDAGIYNHAGPEVSIASTKAFVSQLTTLALMTLFLARERGMSMDEGIVLAEAIASLPEKVSSILAQRVNIEKIAQKYAGCRDMMYIGRGFHAPIASEGALKLKEVTYIHAEAYAGGELKHGPIAMLDGAFPVFAIAPRDDVYEKMVSNIQEVKARAVPVIGLTTEGNRSLDDVVDDIIYIPQIHPLVQPILSVIPLQLFAYYIGVSKGYNVDRPRNLAKSVTVE